MNMAVLARILLNLCLVRKHEKSWGVEASETRSKSLIWDDVVHTEMGYQQD
ncbi:MAG: hypothetical protein QNJ70_11100 [Xenococcaceae cyanobacterium MO_207.B15]|nr:hypothetical protein [Xenococcaceae cyanobacterium MO_207.B15]